MRRERISRDILLLRWTVSTLGIKSWQCIKLCDDWSDDRCIMNWEWCGSYSVLCGVVLALSGGTNDNGMVWCAVWCRPGTCWWHCWQWNGVVATVCCVVSSWHLMVALLTMEWCGNYSVLCGVVLALAGGTTDNGMVWCAVWCRPDTCWWHYWQSQDSSADFRRVNGKRKRKEIFVFKSMKCRWG